jgi:hypothetical protein
VGTDPVDGLLEQHCYKSAAGLLQLVRFYVCRKSVHKPFNKLYSHCLFPVVVTSLKQAVNNLQQAWWHYQTCYKVVLTSLIQSWYNKNVTSLIAQGCNNIVISWLYRTCWKNVATSLIRSTRLLQVVNSLFQTCWQVGQAVRTQLVDGLLADLPQDVRFLRAYTLYIYRVSRNKVKYITKPRQAHRLETVLKLLTAKVTFSNKEFKLN